MLAAAGRMGWGESQIQELRQELAFFAALVQRSSNPPRVRAGSSNARARASSDRETIPSFGKTRYRCAPTVRSTGTRLDLVSREKIALTVFHHDGEQWGKLRRAPEAYE